MKNLITQEVELTNTNKYGNADYQDSQYRDTKTNLNSLNSIDRMEKVIKPLDVFSIRKLMENPNATQNQVRRLLLSLPLKISKITSIKNGNSDITHNTMLEVLSQTDKFFDKKLGGLGW